VLYRRTPAGGYTDLHAFAGGSDGASPFSPPIQASDSNFYGATAGTGFASTVYRYETNGKFTTIHNLANSEGAAVSGPLIQASDGNLYGTAVQGGAYGCGTIFKMTTAGVVLWTYSFTCGSDGGNPTSGVMQASDGNFYGTGVVANQNQNGLVFKLDQNGIVTPLYTFNYVDGASPQSGLTQGTDGKLYGTTVLGGSGASPGGTLFQVTTDGVFKSLYTFTTGGNTPYGTLVQHTNGSFYSTTYLWRPVWLRHGVQA
jgi:uncharacterized repeat protein (TIGR03803 family)